MCKSPSHPSQNVASGRIRMLNADVIDLYIRCREYEDAKMQNAPDYAPGTLDELRPSNISSTGSGRAQNASRRDFEGSRGCKFSSLLRDRC